MSRDLCCVQISWFTSEATLVPGEKKGLLDVPKTLFYYLDLDICTITAFTAGFTVGRKIPKGTTECTSLN